MSWTPNESDIIDYLYGEMTPDRVIKFEEHLKQDDELAKEVKELRATLGVLPAMPDEEVILPARFADEDTPISTRASSRSWLYPVSIAASIAALLLVGYFTKFSISYGEAGFRMAFNDRVEDKTQALTKADVDALIDSRINLVANKWDDKINEVQTSFASQLAQNQQITEVEINRVAALKSKTQIEDEQILAFITQLEEENVKMMQTFYQASADEQQKYMQSILLDFNDYLDNQRQEDLRYIQANLLELKSDSESKQEETDKILASIITTVYNQNSVGQ